MNDYNLFDNRKINSIDFHSVVEYFLKNTINLEKILRTAKPGADAKPITDKDKQKWNDELSSYIESFKNLSKKNNLQKDAVLTNQNGTYFFPKLLQGKHKRMEDSDFVRIYIGLHSSNLIPFFKMFDDLLTGEDVSYSYKFFSVDNNSSDRAVIFINNDSVFKVLEAIEQIKESKPYLFEGAVNKYFTAKVCNGVGLSGDLGYTFTETLTRIMSTFFSKVMQQYPLMESEKIDDVILKALQEALEDSIAIKNGFDFNELYENEQFYLQQVRPILYEKLKDFISMKSGMVIMGRMINTTKGKGFPIYINLVNAFISTLTKEQQTDIRNKLTDYNLFFDLMPETVDELKKRGVKYIQPLSKKNICYFESELKTLQQLFLDYLKQAEEEQSKYLKA